MILTNCPSCAAALPHCSAKQCSRCKTRYCGLACQEQHWKEGGHGKVCKKIKRGGGAEQYHTDKKYAEAVAAAVKKCAEDTKGQACYICTEAVHWKTKEGLVRGCSCRGTAGFAHVSCLAEQAKILLEEAEENNLDLVPRWARWHKCSLCEQLYHGVVRCALGWACWKTYVGRPEVDLSRRLSMTQLGNGLSAAYHHDDEVREAELSMERRLDASKHNILTAQGNLANLYRKLGRHEAALCMRQDVYSGRLKLNGEEDSETLRAANNYALSLCYLQRFEEAKLLLRKMIPVAPRVLGESDELTLKINWNYARAIYKDDGATLDDLREAENTLEDTERTARCVLGGAHPTIAGIEAALRDSRAALRAREESAVGSICKAVKAMTPGGA